MDFLKRPAARARFSYTGKLPASSHKVMPGKAGKLPQVRLFTAIDISEEVRAALRALLDKLRPLAKLGWVSPEKLHITTKFIGEWPEARLGEIHAAVCKIRSG